MITMDMTKSSSAINVLSLARQGASLSLDASQYTDNDLTDIAKAIAQQGAHLTLRNVSGKPMTTLLALGARLGKNLTVEF
ncbi:hypothetical protein IAD21_03130 [Abditibacteriota bacterium]|nr:hypothetical protein IAD21_03130 [Abditibacteriota bacterium]